MPKRFSYYLEIEFEASDEDARYIQENYDETNGFAFYVLQHWMGCFTPDCKNAYHLKVDFMNDKLELIEED